MTIDGARWLRRVGAVVLFAGAAGLFVRCSGSTCNSTNCATGCCDSSGTCQSGNTNAVCGKGGATCGACATGQTCTSSVCTSNGGGGDSGMGNGNDAGNSGNDAGPGRDAGPVVCTHYTTFPAIGQVGDYNPNQIVMGQSNGAVTEAFLFDDGGIDQLANQLYWIVLDAGTTIPPPITRMFGQGVEANFTNCDWCVQMQTGCGPMTCAKNFFAQGGTGTLSKADQDADAGAFIANATNVHLVEWDFGHDQAVPGGACIDIDTMAIDVTWGSMDAGNPTDAGGPSDSGTGPDAGSGTDAGVDAGPPMLTVMNYLSWCNVSVNGAAASSAPVQSVPVTPGAMPLSEQAVSSTFILGLWHHTDGDTDGGGDPGTIVGGVADGGTSSTTVTLGSTNACVWVCCPFANGTGCPTADQCP